MTQVKSLEWAQKNGMEYVKVTYLDGNIALVDTDVCEGRAAVLKDIEEGQFDVFHEYGMFDDAVQVAEWDARFPNAERLFG